MATETLGAGSRLICSVAVLGLVASASPVRADDAAALARPHAAVSDALLGRWTPMSRNAGALTGPIMIDAKVIATRKAGSLRFAAPQPADEVGMLRVKPDSSQSLCGGKRVTFVQVIPSTAGPRTMTLRVLSGEHPVVSDDSLDICAELGYSR